MMIRKYGPLPRVFVPDIGEVIGARRSPADDRFTKAVVIKAQRQRDARIKITVIWMENDPAATPPIVAGETGWVVFYPQNINTVVRQDVRSDPFGQ